MFHEMSKIHCEFKTYVLLAVKQCAFMRDVFDVLVFSLFLFCIISETPNIETLGMFRGFNIFQKSSTYKL